MNKKLITAALILSFMLTACGNADELESSTITEEISTTESKTEPATESTTELTKVSTVITTKKLYDETTTSVNEKDEKDSDDGFKIVDDVLYDYDGIVSEVYIPEGVKSIASRAFWSNKNVEAIFIPSSVEEIGDSAFWSCPALKFVSAEEGLKKIDDSAFWSCSGLSDVELPESVEYISESVFMATNDLTVHAPSGSYAAEFAKNNDFGYTEEKAEYVKIDHKNTINAAQYQYENFTEFTIHENITAIEAEAFQYCKKLESITVPENVDYIGSNAFEYCYGLKNAELSCREIKAEAFEYCKGLVSVVINDGCEKIGSSAFSYCEELSDIYLPASVTDIDKRAFEYCSYELKLHVPSESYAEEYAIAMNIPFDNDVS